MRMFVVMLMLLTVASPAIAQAPTPTPAPVIHAMIAGQQTRFDYIVRAGQVHISSLLTLLIFTVWAFFLFLLFAWVSLLRRRN